MLPAVGCPACVAWCVWRSLVRSAEVVCVLSELWDSKSGNRSDLHEVRVLDEERRTEVQRDDVDDEPARWELTRSSSWSTSRRRRSSNGRSGRTRQRPVIDRNGCTKRRCSARTSESFEGNDRRRRAAERRSRARSTRWCSSSSRSRRWWWWSRACADRYSTASQLRSECLRRTATEPAASIWIATRFESSRRDRCARWRSACVWRSPSTRHLRCTTTQRQRAERRRYGRQHGRSRRRTVRRSSC
jgi:hypothetical protein